MRRVEWHPWVAPRSETPRSRVDAAPAQRTHRKEAVRGTFILIAGLLASACSVERDLSELRFACEQGGPCSDAGFVLDAGDLDSGEADSGEDARVACFGTYSGFYRGDFMGMADAQYLRVDRMMIVFTLGPSTLFNVEARVDPTGRLTYQGVALRLDGQLDLSTCHVSGIWDLESEPGTFDLDRA